MPRRDELYLADVVEACRDVGRFIADLSQDDWLANDLVRYAVLQRLTVIGEAARRLSPDVRGRHVEVPWRLVGDFRNLAVHNYFSVEWPLVWAMARSDVARPGDRDPGGALPGDIGFTGRAISIRRSRVAGRNMIATLRRQLIRIPDGSTDQRL